MLGIRIVLVHGGGIDIEKELNSKNIKSEFKNGLRITDESTMDVVKMVLIGKKNAEIVNMLNIQSCRAVGISGIDANLIKCEKYDESIGLVGKITNINNEIIFNLLQNDYILIISPIGTDQRGNFYNINADTVASEIAISLKCSKLILLTNVDGIMNKENKIISTIDKQSIKELIDNGTISGGMIPKVNACIQCLKNGVERTHILNGSKRNTILYELLTDNGIGTMII